MHFRPLLSWSTLVGLTALLLFSMSCERIEPIAAGPTLAEGEVLYTCESCHLDRSALRKIAVAEEESESAAGG